MFGWMYNTMLEVSDTCHYEVVILLILSEVGCEFNEAEMSSLITVGRLLTRSEGKRGTVGA